MLGMGQYDILKNGVMVLYPILFHIGSIEVRAWGVMVSLGIILGTFIAFRLARREGLDGNLVFDYVLYAVISGFLGARIWEVIFSWENFAGAPLEALKFWSGGLSIQGAVAGGLLFTLWFIRRNNLNFWHFADILAPGLIAGQAIGRIGCFLNGDAYGIPAQSGWGVVYRPGTPAYSAYGDAPLVPAELLEGAGDLAILLLLLLLFRRRPFNGFIALMYFVLYSALRFTLEFWRGDSLLMTEGLKAAQVSSIVIAFAAIGVIIFKLRRRA